MSDDFDLRLRKELGALADAVPTTTTIRPIATVPSYPSDAHAGPLPLERVRIRHGSPVGLTVAAVGLVVVIATVAALSGGLRGGRSATSAMPTASPTASPEGSTPTGPSPTILQPEKVASFGTHNLTGTVLGPPADGAAYVLDDTAGTVYRVDLQTGARLAIVVAGTAPVSGGSIVGNPRLLSTGGQDVLVLDDSNSLWRWRSADKTGRGSLIKVNIPDNKSWGDATRAIGTFLTNPSLGWYNLYVVVPSASQILKYPPALDGSSYPTQGRSNYLAVPQDVSKVDDIYIDGKVYLVNGGKITKYQLGQIVADWSAADPGGQKPYYTRLTADDPAQDQGTFYAYDRTNRRVVAFSKQSGALVAQYGEPAGSTSLSGLTGMFVTNGTAGSAPMLYWTVGGVLMRAPLSATGAPAVTPTSASIADAGSG
ncbi:MAG TPA: hypothetical protein VF344_05050 [Candidatus Limnocylindrales bacterium]